MKKILITGAGGYAGFRIANYLQNAGYEVLGTIRRDIGEVYPFPAEEVDLSKPILLQGKFDTIVHTAGNHPGVSALDLKRDNIDSMANIIEFAIKSEIKQIIYLSSTSIYGTITGDEADESTPVFNPDVYGLTKYMAEVLLKDASNIKSAILRLPGIVGEGANKSWLPSVYQKLIKNEPVTIYSPDFMMNNFVYIDDLAAFIKLLIEENNGKGIYLLGNEEKVSIYGIVKTMQENINSDSEIIIGKGTKAPFSLNIQAALNAGYVSSKVRDIIKVSFNMKNIPRGIFTL